MVSTLLPGAIYGRQILHSCAGTVQFSVTVSSISAVSKLSQGAMRASPALLTR